MSLNIKNSMMSNLNRSTLILGANGFIGRSLMEAMPDHVDGITGSEIRQRGIKSRLLEIRPKCLIFATGSYTNEFKIDFCNNVTTTAEILTVILESGLHIPKIIMFGSAAEYGCQAGPVSIDTQLEPSSAYGLTKVLQYNVAKYFRNKGLNIDYLRLFNVYGEGMSRQLVIGKLYESIEKKMSVVKFGDLSSKRDYIAINAVTKLVVSVCNNGELNRDINVGSGKLTVTRDLVDTIISQAGSCLSYVETSGGETYRSAGEVYVGKWV